MNKAVIKKGKWEFEKELKKIRKKVLTNEFKRRMIRYIKTKASANGIVPRRFFFIQKP